jgi:hypothetical protein
MCRTVSVSISQNLQDGSPLNRPIIHRCPLTGACPMGIATAINNLTLVKTIIEIFIIKA